MTKEALYNAVAQVLAEEITRRVQEKLVDLQKKALVVCTGSNIGFPQWLVSLQQLQQAGFRFDLFLSKNAAAVLDVSVLKMAVPFGKVWVEDSEQPPEMLAAPYPTILVPAMTVATAAKIAACTADTSASRVIFNSMMRGKNVIIAVDGCCPDNEARAAKGYHMTEPLKEQLRLHMRRMEDFGAVLTTAERMSSKALRLIGGVKVEKSAETASGVGVKIPPAKARLQKRILTRQDVAQLPAGTVLQVPKGCQVTQLALDTAKIRRVDIVRETE